MATCWIFVDQTKSWSNFDAAEGLMSLRRVPVKVAKRPCSEFRRFQRKVEIFPSLSGVLRSPQDVIWPILASACRQLALMASRR